MACQRLVNAETGQVPVVRNSTCTISRLIGHLNRIVINSALAMVGFVLSVVKGGLYGPLYVCDFP